MWPFSKKQPETPDFSGRIRHVAFIMDGNGRWAKRRGLARGAGHIQGAKAFRRVVRACHRCGIRFVTVYAFSTENWSRPKEEVDGIMRLLGTSLYHALHLQSEYSHSLYISSQACGERLSRHFQATCHLSQLRIS